MNIQEIPVTERYYPDILQRNEMLQDLLSALEIRKQKNPAKQSEIRKLVELMMTLRNQITKYTMSGEPAGILPTYFTSLIELLEKNNVPLARKVIDAKRILFLDHSTDYYKKDIPDPLNSTWDKIKISYLDDVVNQSIDYVNTQLGKASNEGLAGGALPSWYQNWQTFFNNFFKTWDSEETETATPFQTDTDFLIGPVPDFEDPSNQGLPNASDEDKSISKTRADMVGAEKIGYIQLLTLRGLTSRVARLSEKEFPRIVESKEFATILGYLLFPLRYDIDIGSIRSGKLAIDMGRGLSPRKSIAAILKEQGGISDVPTTGSIFYVNDTSLGNITIEDWLRGQPLYAKSLGDITATLHSFGLANVELTVDQMNVLIEKMDSYRALVRKSITDINAKSASELEAITLENNMFLNDESYQNMRDKFLVEPRFEKKYTEFTNRLPSYRENDIALFSFMTNYLYDLTLATLSGAAGPLAVQIARATRADVFEREHLKYRLKAKKESYGIAPEPNPCEHVEALTLIRKTPDTTQRTLLLIKFIAKYGSEKKDNWLYCQRCSRPCLCSHEALQIQEFLRPREKDAIHKEILLTFSAGSFQNSYMCGNCGQPISQMEYDQSLEYDDEGRPMMGRAVLVDEAAVAEGELSDLLEAPAVKPEEIQLSNEMQTQLYQIARQIMDRVGIQATNEGYRRIAQRAEARLLKQPTRIQYAAYQKQMKTQGQVVIDYDIMISRIQVYTVSAFCLLEIQTAVPGYSVRYTVPGCKPSFAGYPMGEEANKNGIEYIACAVSSIKRNEAPWNLTGFQKEKDDKKRAAIIAKNIVPVCTESIQLSDIQQEIAIKKEYIEKVLKREGAEKGVHELGTERIPLGFLPEPYKREEAMNLGGVPEAASTREKMRAWIVQAHEIAANTAVLSETAVFTETICCRHTLQQPFEFWSEKEKGLPALQGNLGEKISGPQGSHLAIHFKARRLDMLHGEPDDSILYRLFLKVCFRGDRRGLPHEFGYDGVCAHCGFVFRVDGTDDEGKTALDSQQITYSQEEFQSLLDAQHDRYKVASLSKIIPVKGIGLIAKLLAIRPAPFDAWAVVLNKVGTEIQKLSEEKLQSELELATVYGPLSNLAEEFLQEIVVRLGADVGSKLETLARENPGAIVESMRTYFLVPFQRILSDYKLDSLQVPKSYKLGEGTESDILLNLMSQYNWIMPLKSRLKGLTRIKIIHTRDKLAAILPILQEEVRAPVLPGGKIGLEYLLKSIVMGILAECSNPNHIPEDVTMEEEDMATADIQARGAMHIINECISKYSSQSLSYSPDQIRNLIAYRNEIEKMNIIKKMTRMSEEEKALNLMNKRLGLGEWAVGGTKKIYAYDEEQYERERQQRLDMGLVDFRPGEAIAPVGDPEGNEPGGEDGYDVGQMAEDDY